MGARQGLAKASLCLRQKWENSIAPMDVPRRSITFRSLLDGNPLNSLRSNDLAD